MKADLKKLAISFAICSGICLAIGTTNISATNMVSSQDVLEDVYAGAAEVLEVSTSSSKSDSNNITEAVGDNVIQEAEDSVSWNGQGALVMADVKSSVNVRSEASSDADKVGKLYKDCGGYIIEYTDEWTKIQSGEMTGWVCNEYLKFGDEADMMAKQVGLDIATVTCDTLRVRSEANADSSVCGLVGKGEEFEVISGDDEWLAIDFEGQTGYIMAEFVDRQFKIDYGESFAQISARQKAEAAARREAERDQFYGEFGASASDIELLGALIQCEADNQSYEGKVAVGAVVLNRVRSGAYPDSIYGVIYASGQFTPVGSGKVDRRLALGVNPICIEAAKEAISGVSNVGDATHFRTLIPGREGIIIGSHVFW